MQIRLLTLISKFFQYVWKYADIKNVCLKQIRKSENFLVFTPNSKFGNITNEKFGGVKLRGLYFVSEDSKLISAIEALYKNNEDGLTLEKLLDKINLFAAYLIQRDEVDAKAFKYQKIDQIKEDIRYLKLRIIVVQLQRKDHSQLDAQIRFNYILNDSKKLL